MQAWQANPELYGPVHALQEYKLCILDCDSNLVFGKIPRGSGEYGWLLAPVAGAEGMDYVAARKGKLDEVQAITDGGLGAKGGSSVSFKKRVEMVRPSYQDTKLIANAYINSMMLGAEMLASILYDVGMQVRILSGGFKQGIDPFAETILINRRSVDAIWLHFDENGDYAGYEKSPLTEMDDGKTWYVSYLSQRLGIPLDQIVMVGDGGTDMRTKEMLGIGTIQNAQVDFRRDLVDAFTPDTVILPRQKVLSSTEAYEYDVAPSMYPLILALTTPEQQDFILQKEESGNWLDSIHAANIRSAQAECVRHKGLEEFGNSRSQFVEHLTEPQLQNMGVFPMGAEEL